MSFHLDGKETSTPIQRTEEERQFIDDLLLNTKINIEMCMKQYMRKREVVETLSRTKDINPSVTEIVWGRLERDNPEFFRGYYIKLILKDQIIEFNRLLAKQAKLMESSASVSPDDASHPSSNSPQQQNANVIAAQRIKPMIGDDMQQVNMFQNYGSPIRSSVQETKPMIGDDMQQLNMSRNYGSPTQSSVQGTLNKYASLNLFMSQNTNVGLTPAMNGNSTQALSQNPNVGLAPAMNKNCSQAFSQNTNMGLPQMNGEHTQALSQNSNVRFSQAMNGQHTQALSQNTNMGLDQMNGNCTQSLSHNTNMGLPQMNGEHTRAFSQNPNLRFSQEMNGQHTQALSKNSNVRFAQAMNGQHTQALSQNTNMGFDQMKGNCTQALYQNTNMGLPQTNGENTQALSQNSNTRFAQAMNGHHTQALSQNTSMGFDQMNGNCTQALSQNTNMGLFQMNGDHTQALSQNSSVRFAQAMNGNHTHSGFAAGDSSLYFNSPVSFLESSHLGDASVSPFGSLESNRQHSDDHFSDWSSCFREQIRDPMFTTDSELLGSYHVPPPLSRNANDVAVPDGNVTTLDPASDSLKYPFFSDQIE